LLFFSYLITLRNFDSSPKKVLEKEVNSKQLVAPDVQSNYSSITQMMEEGSTLSND
jgi:hypothetical protein